MNTIIDKTEIIEAINNTEDERILFAIKRLLQIEEEEIPAWHKVVLDERTTKINSGQEKYFDWENVKEEIKKID